MLCWPCWAARAVGYPSLGYFGIPQYCLVFFSCINQSALHVAWARYAVTDVMLPCDAIALDKQHKLRAENVQALFVSCLPA